MQAKRRQLLQAGLAGFLFLPQPWAWVWAQSEGTIKLLKAPKVALVVGNGKYKDAPDLKNAPNDAKAIAEALKASGFAVTMLLDTGRDALVQAIRDYVHAMEQKKAVGLFYFAGHGVQLEWRNYMLPIDAVIDKVEDVGKQSVDVARLMEGLTKAANPMNVIILDACRENPFGAAKPVAQKGLSQMDAPIQTILAYATSPGNVASDGDGANGLYTEYLLREMKVPEAKIEDVFKRVRWGVRRTSKGAQIPWESTSLEEDFWFIPPKELKKLSDAEKEGAFKEELAIWERIKAAAEVGPLEDYLKRFPSGRFAELAQLRLEQVLAKQGEKKLAAAAQEGNPYTKGSSVTSIGYAVGDSYGYRLVDYFSKAEKSRLTQTVTQVTDAEVLFDSGLITDLLGNNLRMHTGVRFSPNQTLPFEYAIGKRWPTAFDFFPPNGTRGYAEGEVRVVARESVTVPAGTFNAFRIEIRTRSRVGSLPPSDNEINYWMAPDRVRLQVVREFVQRRVGQVVSAERYELVSFRQS